MLEISFPTTHFPFSQCSVVLWKYTLWFCWFSIVRVGSEDLDVEELRLSNEFEFDISDLLESIHRKATFLMQFSK